MPHSKGGRGPRWTPEEDRELHELAAENRTNGITSWRAEGWWTRRLQAFATKHGRSYDATKKRAQRIGARSYRKAEGATR